MLTTLSSKRIGANLKRLIKESNVLKHRTQECFAEAHNADVRTVRRWIKEGINDIYTVSEVAETLKVDVKALLF